MEQKDLKPAPDTRIEDARDVGLGTVEEERVSDTYKRLLADPNLLVTIYITDDAGVDLHSVVVLESSNTSTDMGYWLKNFYTEEEARAYISKHNLDSRFDGDCTDTRSPCVDDTDEEIFEVTDERVAQTNFYRDNKDSNNRGIHSMEHKNTSTRAIFSFNDPDADAEVARLLSDPNLRITILHNVESGAELYSIAALEASDSDLLGLSWLESFDTEQEAREYISEHDLDSCFDGECVDTI
jgi:hypothetical protein